VAERDEQTRTTDDATGPSSDDHRAVDAQRERYRELLEELRTILPGVQVLFAFLLTVPFSSRFADLDALGRRGFGVALVSSAVATILFLTPAAYHRLTDHQQRGRRLRLSIRVQLAGMVLLAVAVSVAVFVVTRFVFSTTVGGLVGAGIAATTIVLWWLVPVSARRAPRA
jgi:hypothetical protein